MRYVVPVLAAIAIAIAACGDDDASTGATWSPSSGSASTPTPLPSATPTPLPTSSTPPIERVEGVDGYGFYLYDTEAGTMYRTSSFVGWSRDGRLLVATSCCDGGTAFSKLDIATGTEATVGEIDYDPWAPSISPDETMVAFKRRGVLQPSEGLYLVRFGEPTADEIAAQAVGSPAWSSDSRFLAYDNLAYDFREDIVVRDLESGIERTAVPGTLGTTWAWSPTDSVLAYSSAAGLFIYDAETGVTSTIAEGEARGPLVWSPDGTRVVASYGETAILRPAVVGLDGSFVQLPAARGVGWSPDGLQLVYLAHSLNVREDQFHMYTLATGEDVTISAIPDTQKEALGWSPAGGTIAYADLFNAFLYDVSTGTTTALASLPDDYTVHFHNFGWSPDGRYLTISTYGGHG